MEFKLTELLELFDSCKWTKAGKEMIPDLTACKDYVLKRIFATKCAQYVMFENGVIQIRDYDQMNHVYFKRFPDPVRKWYTTGVIPLYNIVVNPNSKERIDFDKCQINAVPSIKAKTKAYKSFTKTVKDKTKRMLDHIKTVWCSNDESQYTYTLQCMKNMFLGKKNNVCFYLRGIEGIGKSMPVEFIVSHVLGGDACCKGSSKMLISDFNMPMMGKYLIVFEELPTFSTSQWCGVSGKLKDYITGKTTMYEEKFVSAISAENAHTIFILTNVNAIKDDNGRRYFILDCSTSKLGDTEYFSALSECFDDEVGECFYNYVLEHIDIPKGWESQKNMPITANKKDSYAMRLCTEYQFLKKRFILNNTGINHRLGALFEDYEQFCRDSRIESSTKIDFHRKLKEVGIQSYDSCGYKKIKVTIDVLKSIASKHHWIHDLDEYSTTETVDEGFDNEYEFGLVKKPDDVNLLREQLEHALNRIKELESDRDRQKQYELDSFPEIFKQNILRLLNEYRFGNQPSEDKPKKIEKCANLKSCSFDSFYK
jgi:hypothetical protein